MERHVVGYHDVNVHSPHCLRDAKRQRNEQHAHERRREQHHWKTHFTRPFKHSYFN